jgi:hypothetical protein
MDLPLLVKFLTWCTIINGGLLLLWSIIIPLAPDFIFRVMARWFPLPKETHNMIMYALLGFFKIIYIFFNVVPLIVLLMLG